MQKDQLKFPITGNEGAPIDRKPGIQWTSNYRQIRPGERISHFFGRTHLQDLLNQQDCMGIRIYYANSMQPNAWQRFLLAISNFLRKGLADAEGEEHLILVGTTREGKDQLPEYGEGQTYGKGEQPKEKSDADKIQPMAFTSAGSGDGFKAIEQSYPCPGSPGCPKNDFTG